MFTDTGEDSKFVHRRKRPKVDTLFPSLFSDASERRVWLSAESKILASTFGRFCLYRLNSWFRADIIFKYSYFFVYIYLHILSCLKSIIQIILILGLNKWSIEIIYQIIFVGSDLSLPVLKLEFKYVSATTFYQNRGWTCTVKETDQKIKENF